MDQDDLLINFGSEVKSLQDGHIGGYLVVFSNDGDTDLDGDFFTKNTNYGFGEKKSINSPVWLHHRAPLKTRDGQKMVAIKTQIGEATLTMDDTGVLADAVLYNREQYEKMLDSLGWSSATAGHLVERKSVGDANEITQWLLGLDASLTPRPAQPMKTQAVTMKAFLKMDSSAMEDEDTEDGKKKPIDKNEEDDSEKSIAEKAQWTAKYKNDLPDSSFAYVAPGGAKNSDGKTTPRSLRYFPYKDADGSPDKAHVKNALARIPQSRVSDTAKATALKKVKAAAKKLGIAVAVDDGKSLKGMFEDELDDRFNSLYSLCDVLQCVLWRLDYMEDQADAAGIAFDLPATVDNVLAEFSARVRAYMIEDEMEEGDEEKSFKALCEPLEKMLQAMPVRKHTEFLIGVADEHARRGAALTADLKALTGRISDKKLQFGKAAIKARINEACEALGTHIDEVTEVKNTLEGLFENPHRKAILELAAQLQQPATEAA